MAISAKQMSTAHSLDLFEPHLSIIGTLIERVSTTKLLGTHIDSTSLLGEKHQASVVILLCYFGNFEKTQKHFIRKTLVQALVLSKLYFSGTVHHNLPDYLANHLQRVQKASASFVLGHFVSINDITKFKWLPIEEQLQWLLLKAVHKAIHSPTWPRYLKL